MGFTPGVINESVLTIAGLGKSRTDQEAKDFVFYHNCRAQLAKVAVPLMFFLVGLDSIFSSKDTIEASNSNSITLLGLFVAFFLSSFRTSSAMRKEVYEQASRAFYNPEDCRKHIYVQVNSTMSAEAYMSFVCCIAQAAVSISYLKSSEADSGNECAALLSMISTVFSFWELASICIFALRPFPPHSMVQELRSLDLIILEKTTTNQSTKSDQEKTNHKSPYAIITEGASD